MGRVIAKRELQRHPDCASPAISVAAKAMVIGSDVLRFDYLVAGKLGSIVIPPPTLGQRSDRLWEHTCVEAFIGMADGSYVEVNVAPSTLWATYHFQSYRSGMRQSSVQLFPHREAGEAGLRLTASVDMRSLPASPVRLGISAVIEAVDGSKSYWALAHPPGAPDFHHPDCFALELPAPDAA